MKKMIFLFLTLILGFGAQATEKTLLMKETIPCQLTGKNIKFDGADSNYELYEKSFKNTELVQCQKVTIAREAFYTALMKSDEQSATGKHDRVLVFEIAKVSGKKLNTVRSETIDRIDLNTDLPQIDFVNELTTVWGVNKKDQTIMIKMTIKNKMDSSESISYLLKLNQEKSWFVNSL